MSPVERITDPGDPRLRDFTQLRDVEVRSAREPAEGLFIAEGSATIGRALDAGYEPRAALTTDRWLESMEATIGDAPILVVDDEVLADTTGFPVHRGALASMSRRPLPSLEEVVGADVARVVVLEDLVDHTNVGAAFRSVAALGFDAVLLTPRCADPLYRRAIRTSMGAVFSVPWTRLDWFEGPEHLRAHGLAIVALTPSEAASDLRRFEPPPRFALAFGSEGEGLSSHWMDGADAHVRIPMAHGVDSLNVAATAAIACFALGPPTAR